MKNRSISKKFLATLLAVIMLVGTLYVPASAKGFSDISSSHASLDAINYVSDNAIMAGTSSTTFSPNTEVTRGMVVTVLYQKAGAPAVSGTNKFTDVSSSAYYYKAVLWASTNGIAGGTSSTTFSPDNKITRQDAALMLYNLGKKMGYDVSKTTSITGCFDYSSVSTYARTAMAWGVATDVVPADSGYLYPTHTVTRAQLAEFVTAFGINVEKIIHGKDDLGFTNYATSEKRYITTAHYEKLKSLIRAAYGSANAESNIKSVQDRLRLNCTGMCYGMTVVAMLDKLGKIAFNENYSTAKTMYGIKQSAVSKSKVESALNFYHVSSSLPGDNHYDLNKPISNQVTAAVNVMLNSNRPCLFEHYYTRIEGGQEKTFGHEIIVNSCKRSGSSYILDIIDPNGPTHTQKTLTADGKLGSTQLVTLFARNDYSFLDKIDIDSYKNTDSSANSAATVSLDDEILMDEVQYPGAFSTLEIALTGDFSIRNADGESLQWDGLNLSGDMETYAVRLSPQGENTAAIMYIDVPLSTNYYFESLTAGMEVWFSVADQYRYSRISGTDLTSFSVDEEGIMEADCKKASLDVAFGAPGMNTPLISLSGQGNGHVIMEYDDNSLKASGGINDYKIQAIDINGNLMYNQTVVIDSEPEIADDGNLSQAAADEVIS